MAFIIGVAGQAQMGKDTLSDYLAEKLTNKWKRVAFADNVKKVYQDTFDCDRSFVEKWKVRPEPPPGFDMTVRKSLQFIGDGFRKICPNIWLDLVFRRETEPIIISDVRYVNEFLRVKEEGGLNILVGRKDKLSDDPNGSEAHIRPYVEWCLDNFNYKIVNVIGSGNVPEDVPEDIPEINEFDLFINNSKTVEDLYRVIDNEVVPFVERFVFQFNEVE